LRIIPDTVSKISPPIILICLFFAQDLSYVALWAASFLVYQYVLNLQDMKKVTLNEKRNEWMRELLLQQIDRNPENIAYINKLTKNRSDFSNAELAYQSPNTTEYILPPDVQIAEEEMVKLEERSSIILTAVIFIPIIFALAHLFRDVHPGNVVIELLAAMTIIRSLTLYYEKAIKLTGWTEALQRLQNVKKNLIAEGKKALLNIRDLYTNFNDIELGREILVAQENPAKEAVGTAALIIASSPIHVRQNIFNQFVKGTDSLPFKEKLMEVRWKALKGRAILITTVGVAMTGVLAGLASFSFTELFSAVPSIQPTRMLGIYLLILSQASSILLTRPWISAQLPWQIFWGTVFALSYYAVLLFIF